MGAVPYRGVYHEGTHQPLISVDLWLRVQQILTAHHLAGERERKHPHYLKGSIFCGGCGARLIYSRNRGNGGEYEYYTCLSRRTGRKPCNRKHVRLERIEDGVAQFIIEELSADREQAASDTERARPGLGPLGRRAPKATDRALRRRRTTRRSKDRNGSADAGDGRRPSMRSKRQREQWWIFKARWTKR